MIESIYVLSLRHVLPSGAYASSCRQLIAFRTRLWVFNSRGPASLIFFQIKQTPSSSPSPHKIDFNTTTKPNKAKIIYNNIDTVEQMKRFSPLSVLILAVLCILGSLASPAAAMPGYRGTFDQDEACKGQDGIVLKSDADAGTMPNGYFVYSGGLIFCCSGRAFDVMCSEMMEGYCECAEDIKATNEDELLQTTDKEYTEIVKTCYAQKCTSQIKATPIKDGVPVKSGPAAMCWMPEDVTLQARGFTNNVTVMAQDFCAAYAPLRVPPKSVPTKNPEKTGTFELLKNEQTGISSTGIVPVHLAMIPRTEKVVI